jgi:hypothetical protein
LLRRIMLLALLNYFRRPQIIKNQSSSIIQFEESLQEELRTRCPARRGPLASKSCEDVSIDVPHSWQKTIYGMNLRMKELEVRSKDKSTNRDRPQRGGTSIGSPFPNLLEWASFERAKPIVDPRGGLHTARYSRDGGVIGVV